MNFLALTIPRTRERIIHVINENENREFRQEHQVRKRGDVIALDVGRKVRKTKKAARASLQKLLREGYAKISCFHLLLLAPSRSMFGI